MSAPGLRICPSVRVLFLGLLIIQTNAAQARAQSYIPASYESVSTASGKVDAFPFDGSTFSMSVPGWHGAPVYGFDGATLYVTTAELGIIPAGRGRPERPAAVSVPGLFKIDLDSGRVSAVPGSAEFPFILSFVVSQLQDKMVVSGHRRSRGRDTCGLFEIALPGGAVRPLFESSECKVLPYGVVSLAPDVQHAVTVRETHLYLLDLASGTEKPLLNSGEKFSRAGWSPDGKWIAALVLTVSAEGNDGGSKTVLLNPNDPDQRREFQGRNDGEVVWSPDSRYLLHAVWSSKPMSSDCLTLETLDIATGERRFLAASKCKVQSHDIGWVSSRLSSLNAPPRGGK